MDRLLVHVLTVKRVWNRFLGSAPNGGAEQLVHDETSLVWTRKVEEKQKKTRNEERVFQAREMEASNQLFSSDFTPSRLLFPPARFASVRIWAAARMAREGARRRPRPDQL